MRRGHSRNRSRPGFTLALLGRVGAVKFTVSVLVAFAVVSIFKWETWSVALVFYFYPMVLNFFVGGVTARLMLRGVLIERSATVIILLLSLGCLFFCASMNVAIL